MLVKGGSNGIVERFYWVQFEHDLPNNNGTYDVLRRGDLIQILADRKFATHGSEMFKEMSGGRM